MSEDYPRTLIELERRFGSEEACAEYLTGLRWPDGWVCPRCAGSQAWAVRRNRWRCDQCRYEMSVTAGTILQDSHVPLTIGLRAMWHVTSQKNGMSALGLQRVLGLGSYKTAWAMLHKLGRAMVRPGRERLSGSVEAEETYLGGLEEGVRGRQTESKALIVVAAEENGKGIGRIRMRHIPDASARSLVGFVEESVEPGSVVHTDGWLGYEPLQARGYIHRVTFLRGHEKSPSELLPRVHRVISLLKRWLLGTHQGAIGQDHLDDYLNEFTFRFNRRTSASRGKLFYRLAQQAVHVDPAPFASLVKPQPIAFGGVK
jgi:transposase-like protein